MRCKKVKKAKWSGVYFIVPSFVGVLIFVLIPYLDVMRRAFTQTTTGKFIGFEHFVMILENKAFRLAVWNTLHLVIVSIPILVLSSLLIAVFLQKKTKLVQSIKCGFLIPMAIPVASVVLIWQCIFNNKGFLNGFLHMCGFEGVDWMNTGYSFGILVFSYIWKNLGYSIILWLAGLSTISREIYEAARVDGAGEVNCFFQIAVPNLWPTFFTITVLSLINSFKVFREAYLVAGAYPDKSIYLLQHLFNNWFRDLSLDKMAAGAVLNGVVMFGFIWILWKTWGIKEQ